MFMLPLHHSPVMGEPGFEPGPLTYQVNGNVIPPGIRPTVFKIVATRFG